jgi:hypothetical protein
MLLISNGFFWRFVDYTTDYTMASKSTPGSITGEEFERSGRSGGGA